MKKREKSKKISAEHKVHILFEIILVIINAIF